jgi:hypothetical protein
MNTKRSFSKKQLNQMEETKLKTKVKMLLKNQNKDKNKSERKTTEKHQTKKINI